MAVASVILQQYTSGYFDGDGSISLRIAKSKTSVGYDCTPAVYIISAITRSLDKIEEWCQESKIKLNRYIRRGPTYTEEIVISRRHCKAFLYLVKDYLWTTKREQAEITLSEVFPKIESQVHLTKEGFLDLMESIDKVNQLKGKRRGRYTRDYFAELWKDDMTTRDKRKTGPKPKSTHSNPSTNPSSSSAMS